MDCINKIEHFLLAAGFNVSNNVFWVSDVEHYSVEVVIKDEQVIIREWGVINDEVTWLFLKDEKEIFAKLREINDRLDEGI